MSTIFSFKIFLAISKTQDSLAHLVMDQDATNWLINVRFKYFHASIQDSILYMLKRTVHVCMYHSNIKAGDNFLTTFKLSIFLSFVYFFHNNGICPYTKPWKMNIIWTKWTTQSYRRMFILYMMIVWIFLHFAHTFCLYI